MQSTNINSITFCFPYHEVSGVPVLFSNLANFISNNFPLEVSIVDFMDGYMTTTLEKNKKVKNFIFKTGMPVYIDTDVLVMQSIFPFGIRPEINISPMTKIFFWNLHPNNLIPNVYPWAILNNSFPQLYRKLVALLWSKKYDLMKTFIKESVSLGSLNFMDSANLNHTEEFYSMSLPPISFLPIACAHGKFRDLYYKTDFNTIHFSWIGRLCDFKIHILNYLIIRLSNVAKNLNQKIVLHIIGDGPEENNLNYKKYLNSYFSVIKHGSMNKSKMDEFLFSTIDINASMGTSILESAKYGIPSIVMDFDMKPIKKNYHFRWLHDTKGFDVGHIITESDYSLVTDTLKKMVEEFIINREYLSQKSYDYYNTNHSLEVVSNKLLDQVQKSELTVSKINSTLMQKGLIRRFYERRKYGKISKI